MNGKQAKRCRSRAYAEAKKQDLWNKGKASLFSKWWRRLLNLFPRFRKRYDNAIGRWYKATIKRWTRETYAYIHDRDAQRMAAAMARSQRKRAIERAKRKVA